MSISSVNGVASTVSRYRFVAAGGETSLTGSDANGATLSYLVGKEEVYLNGALLVRGQDYTGTDGATISALTALVAGDTVEIITFVPFAIPTAISSATVTTQGDLIVATGASAVTRLGVGTSGQLLVSNGTTPAYTSTVTGTLNNGTLTGTLTAASSAGTSGQLLSSTGTGVQWVAAPSAGPGNLAQIATSSLSGTSVSITGLSSYTNLYLQVANAAWTDAGQAAGDILVRINNNSGSSNYTFAGVWFRGTSYGSNASKTFGTAGALNPTLNQSSSWYISQPTAIAVSLGNCKTTGYTSYKFINSNSNQNNGTGESLNIEGIYTQNEAVSSLQIVQAGGFPFSQGTYTVWGS
jgi:hypothetical protein